MNPKLDINDNDFGDEYHYELVQTKNLNFQLKRLKFYMERVFNSAGKKKKKERMEIRTE